MNISNISNDFKSMAKKIITEAKNTERNYIISVCEAILKDNPDITGKELLTIIKLL